jgi:hypothetical protein
MKYAGLTLLVMASTAATLAFAQDGAGHGPPKSSSIIIVPQLPVPIPGMPTGYVQKLFQPQSELASMTK